MAEIAGLGGAGLAGGHDLITATADIDLDVGQLQVTLLDGFMPSDGDKFTILTTSTNIRETFGNTTLPALSNGNELSINYTANSVQLEVSATLPIELQSFTVYAEGDHHQLEWSTITEINSAYFEIAYSTDGRNWQQRGRVEAQGFSQNRQQYKYRHQKMMPTTDHYYRLKLVDRDGSISYSRIKVLQQQTSESVSIYPNPFAKRGKTYQQTTKGNLQNLIAKKF